MISRKTIHAIDLCIALASQGRNEYLTTHALAPHMGLSVSYLENILKTLKAHDLVSAMKGPGGGYRLSFDPSLVSVWDVVEIFEKEVPIKDKSLSSQIQPYEIELDRVIQHTLDSFYLSDFAQAKPYQSNVNSMVTGQFQLKPMAPPMMPKAPNSVFQLHMMV